MNLIDILIFVAIAGVVGTLVLGLINMYRGGDEARMRSNKLMRYRIVFQAVAVLLLLVAMVFKAKQGL